MKNNLLHCKVIMLPTEKASKILDYTNLIKKSNKSNTAFEANGYNLYFTSEREIKEGDWVYRMDTGNIHKSGGSTENYVGIANTGGVRKDLCKKIEATTDFSLKNTRYVNDLGEVGVYLPQIPESFIQAYVKVNGDIKDVNIELVNNSSDNYQYYENHKSSLGEDLKVKVREDNTVIIHQLRTYTREDMYECAKRFGNMHLTDEIFSKWLNNL